MNETVDNVYRFVTDQSSSAYHKMNSIVASLRRRIDKVLTVAANNAQNSTSRSSLSISDPSVLKDGEHASLDQLITDARLLLAANSTDQDNLKCSLHAVESLRDDVQCYSPASARRLIDELRSFIHKSHSDQDYVSSLKVDSRRPTDETANVYDRLHKDRPVARSNPNVNHSQAYEAGKPAHLQRHSLRSSMRHFLKRRSMKDPSKKFLGTSNEPPHIYESLDTPSPSTPPTRNPLGEISDEHDYIAPSVSPPVFKSSYILPSSLVVLDHFTTNLYLVVNCKLNQLLVVFGSTKIHAIKLYDTNGRKLHVNDLTLQYRFEDLHGYKLFSSAVNGAMHNRLIVNEIRVYISQPSDDLHAVALSNQNNQTLKQRLLYFDQQGQYMAASKRLPVINELLFVEVDRSNGSIYAYDGLNLINIDQNWSISIDNLDCIASGSTFLVGLHTKTNQISIYQSQTGSFVYRWLITSPNIRHLQAIHLCVSRDHLIYVLVWNFDVQPANNLVLVFDREGQLRREYYMPNRIIPNIHGTYTYDMTIGPGSHHSNGSGLSNLLRHPSRKPDGHELAWMQQQALWNANGRHPQIWANPGASPFRQLYRGVGRAYDLIYTTQHPATAHSSHEDHALFHARFVAITDDNTLILSNIVDLGLDEETQETAVVNVSRKVLFFHLDL
jgi:hypothetical protein